MGRLADNVLPPRKKRGRPRHKISEEERQQVLTLAGLGVPQAQIAKLLRMGLLTLRQYYEQELHDGMVRANAAVAQSLFNMATRDKMPSAAIFWLRVRAGWRDQTPEEAQTGPSEVTYRWSDTQPTALPSPTTIDATPEPVGSD